MRKLILIIFVSMLAVACQNQENEFPDFDYNAVYFPQQYPVRTLILGDDRGDNSMDKLLKFHIGVSIGGMYENSKNWNVNYVVDNTLAGRLKNQNGDTLIVLPTSYYTITPAGTIVIPKGSFDGLAEVQLKDAFLDDPRALKGTYVIPLRITTSDADSVLHGQSTVTNPNRNRTTDWNPSALPKDFTLFAITFINPFHGVYLHRGVDQTFDAAGTTLQSTTVFHQKFVEQDQLITLTTSGRSTILTNGVANNIGSNNAMKLTFDANGNVTVGSISNSPRLITTGTGKFVNDGDSWGGEKKDVIYLDYQYTISSTLHKVKDTLVFRNNNVTYKTNTITLY
jgi:hypothetical protein